MKTVIAFLINGVLFASLCDDLSVLCGKKIKLAISKKLKAISLLFA
jgi:hypothetical protein